MPPMMRQCKQLSNYDFYDSIKSDALLKAIVQQKKNIIESLLISKNVLCAGSGSVYRL